jgi:4-hydroxy-2-oxoheptanedioate aldolase
MIEMRMNKAKDSLYNGNVVSVPLGPFTPDLIEHFGPLGFDGIWIEGEHGPVDFGDIPDLTRACDLWGLTSVVRVHQNEPSVIYRTMDLGAQSIVVPHVNTKNEALSVVDAAKFQPLGNRGSFTSRQGIGVENYFKKANDQTMVIILIEDIIAINNLDEILEVDNIDVFFVAPGDLAQTMGFPGGANLPVVQQTLTEAINKINSCGKYAGTLCNVDNVKSYIDVGAKFIGFSWLTWLNKGAKDFHNSI